MAKKNSLWRRYKANRCTKRKQAYLVMAKTCKSQMEAHELEAEKKILRGKNLGYFYCFVNSKLNSKSGVGPLKNSSTGYATSPLDKANLLNGYFCSTCLIDDNTLPPFKNRVGENVGLEDIAFSQTGVYSILDK